MLHVTEIIDAERVFHHQYGLTLAQWATIEQRLFHWFHYATDVPEEMARGIFYSAKNFNGRADMLEAAIRTSSKLSELERRVAEKAIRRCRSYSTFRNKITHGETVVDVRVESPTFKQVLLIEGKDLMHVAATDAICVDYLAWGHDQLRQLSKLVMDGLQGCHTKDGSLLERCITEFEQLPRSLYPNPRNNPTRNH